jgi:hypothetical protein
MTMWRWPSRIISFIFPLHRRNKIALGVSYDGSPADCRVQRK